VLCESYIATIDSGIGNVSWTNCDGSSGFAEVIPAEPVSFCAQVDTPSSSTPTVSIDPTGPCESPEVGCYTITFNPDSGCPTNPSGVEISYTQCNGNQVIAQVIPTGSSFTTCALIGGTGLQPAYACGTGTISLGDPCIQLGLISSTSDSEDACPLSMNVNCWISGTGEPNAGDVIYTDAAMTTVFPGDGNFYHFTIQSSTLSYSAQVDNNGVIQGGLFAICA
jgi:hypothetical protein